MALGFSSQNLPSHSPSSKPGFFHGSQPIVSPKICCVSSREFFDAAMAAGATLTRPPEDHGFMYSRAFNDLDGHVWEAFWMDPAAVQDH